MRPIAIVTTVSHTVCTKIQPWRRFRHDCLRVMIPAIENSVSGSSYRPGDVLISRKGLSVEIGNTDAEGRLILADALCYAVEQGADDELEED